MDRELSSFAAAAQASSRVSRFRVRTATPLGDGARVAQGTPVFGSDVPLFDQSHREAAASLLERPAVEETAALEVIRA